MNKSMTEFFAEKSREKIATDHGTNIHRQLQFLQLDADNEIAKKIKSNPELSQFWNPGSRSEVPIVGTINGTFYSKRIDRLAFGAGGEILFLDYKTDTNRARRNEYEKTMKIYATLLGDAFPDKKVSGFILWLNNFELEMIV